MAGFSTEISLDRELNERVVFTGIVLLIIGTTGIVFPQPVLTDMALFIATLLILSSQVIAYATWLGYGKSWLAWLKPVVLLVLGTVIGLHQADNAAVLGILLVIYFLLDGFASMSFAFQIRSLKGSGWVLINGLFSLLLAIIFLTDWPFSSIWLVGLFVGISLILDGLCILVLDLVARGA